MSEAREGYSPGADSEKVSEQVFTLKIRGPLLVHIADKLAPVYLEELRKIKEDGAYKPLVEFYDSPFGSVISRILDTIDDSSKRPEVREFEMSQAEYDQILTKLPQEESFAQHKISREMKDELKTVFRDAKFNAKVKNAITKVKKKLKGN